MQQIDINRKVVSTLRSIRDAALTPGISDAAFRRIVEECLTEFITKVEREMPQLVQ